MKLLSTLDNQNKVTAIPQGHLEQTAEDNQAYWSISLGFSRVE